MRKYAAICLLFFAISLCLCSCSGKNPPSAHRMMEEFLSLYNASGVLFSPDIPEGEPGYCAEDFFGKIYGRSPDGIVDYAVLLLSKLSGAGECAVFVCATAYDAKSVLELCENRLSLIRSLAFGVDTSFADDAFFLRSGNTVVFCALEDNSSARAAWKRVLRTFA